MSHLLAVRIPVGNRLFFYHSGPYVVTAGDHVLVHAEGDLHMGAVERVSPLPDPPPRQVQSDEEITVIFRPATGDDMARDLENRNLAAQAFDFCRQRIQERSLDMKLVDVLVLFDGSKIVFFFTAPSRIDFRELVKDLVRAFRTRIELRQIGARHETQMIGGVGNCGQLVCCRRFLRQFAPATIKMAKEQNLFLNPAKISGVCNRLLCCLSFEQSNYEEFLAHCPKVGKKFVTSQGTAKVVRANYFRRTLSVWMEPGGEREIGLDEWDRLVDPKRTAATRQDAQPRARVVESAVVVSAAPQAPDSSPAQATPPEALEGAEGKGPSGRETPAEPKAEQLQAPEKNGQGRTKKAGKPRSRKTKRRGRSSRGKSRSRGQSPSPPSGQSPGKTRKKSPGQS